MESSKTIPTDTVHQHLEKILQSHAFRQSKILTRFLQYIVTQKLLGKEQELKEYIIGLNALGKAKDFNPQLDSIVRIHAGRLREALFKYYNTEGKSDEVVISLPKGAYIPSFQTAQKTSKDIHRSPKAVLTNLPEEPNIYPVIAVFPFRNLSVDHSKDYFVAGFAEQLTIDLSRFQNLSVVSNYSMQDISLDPDTLKKLESSTGASYVLTGSVRFYNEKFRVNVQLIDTGNGRTCWVETYEHLFDANAVFELQEDITSQIVNILADDFGVLLRLNQQSSNCSQGSATIQYQEAIHKYYDYTINYEKRRRLDAFDTVRDKINKYGEHSLPLAILAKLYIDLYIEEPENEDGYRNEACKYAARAVALNENCQHSLKSMGWAELISGNKNEAIESFDRCIRLNNKSCRMLACVGFGYVSMGEYETGYKHLQKAFKLSSGISIPARCGLILHALKFRDSEQAGRLLESPVAHEYLPLQLLELAVKKMYPSTTFNTVHENQELVNNYSRILPRFIHDAALSNQLLSGLAATVIYR